MALAGCAGPADDDLSADPDLDHLVPVRGTVTSEGKPLAKAVVTFLSGPIVGNGETDEQGRYSLTIMGHDGLPPGDYTVSVSYLVSADGEPQGAGARSSQIQGKGMLTAKELVPAEYSDLGRTKLRKAVGEKGGQFDFEVPVKAPPAAGPSPSKAAAESPSKAADEAPAAPPAGGGGAPVEKPRDQDQGKSSK